MLTLKNFDNQINSVILQKGKDYYGNGSVVFIEDSSNGLWSAEVEGSATYLVEVRIEKSDSINNYSCNCPYDGGVCKHVVAVFLPCG